MVQNSRALWESFGPGQNSISKIDTNSTLPLYLNNVMIQETISHKHLGLTFSDNCSRSEPIYSIARVAWQRNMLGNLKFKLKRQSLERIRPLCGITAHKKTLTKVCKGAKIRNRYNQVPHVTQYTNGKVTNSQLDTTNESREVSPFPAGDHKAHIMLRHKAGQEGRGEILLENSFM